MSYAKLSWLFTRVSPDANSSLGILFLRFRLRPPVVLLLWTPRVQSAWRLCFHRDPREYDLPEALCPLKFAAQADPESAAESCAAAAGRRTPGRSPLRAATSLPPRKAPRRFGVR